MMNPKIAIIGLGYVGLPLALEFAKKYQVIGFDISHERVKLMQQSIDPSSELTSSAFVNKNITFTAHLDDIKIANFYIVTVPTPVNEYKIPDLTPLIKASESLGKVIKKGDIVVYESTVYPGCTEEDCIPIIEQISGLQRNIDFKFGYSPERINPGDKKHTVVDILKIVSGSDQEALQLIASLYGSIIKAGIYEAESVKVAEAAKVIENAQRDLNIAFMNELAIIFDRMGIDTQSVLAAAATKWNFIKMYPGFVGGHCIGVDPYYLSYKSEQQGYTPQVILSGRRINDNMPAWVAQKLVQKLAKQKKAPSNCYVLVKGITFKENVTDIRNSKVADLVKELQNYDITVHINDPHAATNEVQHEYGLTMTPPNELSQNYDAVVVAVAHEEYKNLDINYFKNITTPNGIVIDLKGIYDRHTFIADNSLDYWRL